MVDPIDRSNSPPIIKRATATARMPSWGGHLEEIGDARRAEQSAVAGKQREEQEHQDRAAQGPEFGPPHDAGEPACLSVPGRLAVRPVRPSDVSPYPMDPLSWLLQRKAGHDAVPARTVSGCRLGQFRDGSGILLCHEGRAGQNSDAGKVL